MNSNLNPPPQKGAAPEVTGDPQHAPARKKPWAKPSIRRIEDGVLLTESSPDPDTREDHSYYVTS